MKRKLLTLLYFIIFTVNMLNSQSTLSIITPFLKQGTHTNIINTFTNQAAKELITVGQDGVVKCFDLEKGLIKQILNLGAFNAKNDYWTLTTADYLPQKNWLAIVWRVNTNESEIWIIDLTKQVFVKKLKRLEGSIEALNFSPDGSLLATASLTRIDIINTRNWQIIFKQQPALSEQITHIRFSSNNSFLTASKSGNLYLWQKKRKNYSSKILEKKHSFEISSILFLYKGDYFITAGLQDGKLLLWEGNGTFKRTLYQTPKYTYPNTHGFAGALSLSSSGGLIAFSEIIFHRTHIEPQINLYDLKQHKILKKIGGYENLIFKTAFVDDKHIITSEKGSGNIVARNIDSLNSLYHWGNIGYTATNLSFGGKINVQLEDKRNPIYFDWETLSLTPHPISEEDFFTTGIDRSGLQKTPENPFLLRRKGASVIQLNPNLKEVINDYFKVGEEDAFVITNHDLFKYDASGKLIASFKGWTNRLNKFALSKNEQFLVGTGYSQLFYLWSVSTHELLATLYIDQQNEWVCWIPSGYYAASKNGHQYLGIAKSQPNKLKLPQLLTTQEIRRQFYKPEKIKQFILSKNYKGGEHKKIIIEKGIANTDTVLHIPDFNYTAFIHSITPIKSVDIFLNDKRQTLGNKTIRSTYNWSIDVPLMLEKGANNLKLTVVSQDDSITDKSIIKYTPKPLVLLSKSHTLDIRDIAFSRDGVFLATTGMDKSLKVWKANYNKLLYTINANGRNGENYGGAEYVDISSNSDYLAHNFGEHQIIIRDLKTGNILQIITDQHLRPSERLTSLKFIPFREEIATSDQFGNIKFWDIKTGLIKKILPLHQHKVTNFVFSGNGRYLISADEQVIHKYDLEKEAIIASVPLDYSIDKKQEVHRDFLQTGENGQLCIWGNRSMNRVFAYDFSQQKTLAVIDGGDKNKNRILSAILSPDLTKIAISNSDAPIHVFQVKDGTLVGKYRPESIYSNKIIYHPTNNSLYSFHNAIDNNKVRVYSTNLATPQSKSSFGGTDNLRCFDVSKSGRYIVAGSRSNTLTLVDLKYLNSQNYNVHRFCNFQTGIFDVKFSQDEQYIASAHCDGKINIWKTEVQQLKPLISFSHLKGAVRSLDFSKDGKHLVSAGADKIITVRSFPTGEIVKKLDRHQRSIGKLTFSENGKYLASMDYQNIIIWDTKEWKPLRTIPIELPNFHSIEKPINTGLSFPAIPGAIDEEKDRMNFYTYDISFTTDSKFIVLVGSIWGEIVRYNIENGDKVMLKSAQKSYEKYLSISVEDSGRYLATGTSFSNGIELFERESGNRIVKIDNAHLEAVMKVKYIKEGTRLVSCSDDGTIKIWNILDNELKEILLLNFDAEGNYFFKTPKGYYHTSRIGAMDLAYKIGHTVYGSEQFDLHFNRPDIVLKTLGKTTPTLLNTYHYAYKKRLKKLNFTEEMLSTDFHVPVIEIVGKNNISHIKKMEYGISIKAKDTKHKLNRLNVYINDVPIHGKNGIDLRPLNTFSLEREIKFALSQGVNKIQVSVHNQAAVESLKETFYINYEGIVKKPDLHLLVIGVNEYEYEKNLNFPEKDAMDILQLFEKKAANFGEIHKYSLLEDKFSATNLKEVATALKQTKVNDIVIIFYAGHGFLDRAGNFFLTTSKTNSAKIATAIPYETLEDLLDGIPARQKLILIDACHSGEVDIDYENHIENVNAVNTDIKFRSTRDVGERMPALGMNNSFELMKALFVDLRRGTGATIIAAARGVEVAQESTQWNNGVFTYTILQGLLQKEADFNKDGIITVSDLKKYVSEKVPELTNGLQQPTSRLENISNDFRIW